MAKILLWFFVIGNAITFFIGAYLLDEAIPYEKKVPVWIAIAILAICEAIEGKVKKC